MVNKWHGLRINFGYLDCPACGLEMNCNYVPELDKILKEAKDLKMAVKKRAVERLKIEGLDKDERLANPEDAFFNRPEEYAMHKLAYYECFTCKGPFFGGLRDCEMEL